MNDSKAKIGSFESSTDYADYTEKAECHTQNMALELLFAVGVKRRLNTSAKEQMEISKTNFDEASQGYTHYNHYVHYHNNYKIHDNLKRLLEINKAMIKIYLLTFFSANANTQYQELCKMHAKLTSDTAARLLVRTSLEKEAAENLEKLAAEEEALNNRLEAMGPELKERLLQLAQEMRGMNQGSLSLGNSNRSSLNFRSSNTSAPTPNGVDEKTPKPNNKAKQK